MLNHTCNGLVKKPLQFFAGSLLTLAVLGSGAGSVWADTDQSAPKKELPQKGRIEKKIDPAAPFDAEQLRKALEGLQGAQGIDPEKLQKEVMKAVQEALQRGGVPGLPGGQGVLDEKQRQELRKQMEEMRQQFGQGQFTLRTPSEQGRLGVQVAKPSDVLADQLDLPKNRGLVVSDVHKDSAAAKAGIKANDIILEFGGKPVPSDVADFVKLLKDVQADKPVDAVVLRKGKKETIKGVTLPETKKEPRREGFQNLRNFRGFPQGKGGPGVIISTARDGDKLTAKHKEGDLVLSVTGTVAGGKTKVSEITIQDGGTTNKYGNVDQVPEKYRDKVQKLLDMSEKGELKIEGKEEK